VYPQVAPGVLCLQEANLHLKKSRMEVLATGPELRKEQLWDCVGRAKARGIAICDGELLSVILSPQASLIASARLSGSP